MSNKPEISERATTSDFLPNYMRTLPAAQFRVPAERAIEFRERHKLKFPDIDRLLGFTSKGRASRLWEENGAPPYVEVLMAYIDKYGADLALEIADKRDAQHIAAFNADPKRRHNKKALDTKTSST